MEELESARLRIREAEADDLPGLLPTYLSNPAFLAMNEGSGGDPGHYDLAMLQRDWQVQRMLPGAHMLGIYLKETGAAAGMAGYLDENPDDGMPWLGSLMLRADLHGCGLGREAFERLVEHFRSDLGWTQVRAAVWCENEHGLAFLRRMGFAPVEQVGGQRRAIVLERAL